jgi:hypothetical protein
MQDTHLDASFETKLMQDTHLDASFEAIAALL